MFGKKINNTRVVPVTLKIVVTFTIFLLVSNLSSNYINLIFNRSELLKLMNQLLTKDLKDVYSFCNNQFEIYQYDKNLESSIESIEKKGLYEMKNSKAVTMGIEPEGKMFFQASKIKHYDNFADNAALEKMRKSLKAGTDEGNLHFRFNNEDYFGLYKYNTKWNIFIIRAEEVDEFYADSNKIFVMVSVIILVMTVIMVVIGIIIIRIILRYIDIITSSIMRMVQTQDIGIIDLSKASNDDITYMGAAFNSLSSTVDNLIGIFRKFANQDIVLKAYRDRNVKLEGTRKELTILFSDIKSFTYITETLGPEIIKLLNMHYDRSIREIVTLDGVIGSIIGDALLAVFGAFDEKTTNKSLQAIMAGFKLHEVTDALRLRMTRIKNEVEAENGKLSPEEERVYKAVLLEIGVGIDGGEVFYGTLGSYVRMTNTVIGDNVNAASRMEGLTRIYKTPIIVSEYVKKDVEENVQNHGIHFVELDRVMVKGKTSAQRIFWPILETDFDRSLSKNLSAFEEGLELYYDGQWTKARKVFKRCQLPVAEVFLDRTSGSAPKGWKGVWEMRTK